MAKRKKPKRLYLKLKHQRNQNQNKRNLIAEVITRGQRKQDETKSKLHSCFNRCIANANESVKQTKSKKSSKKQKTRKKLKNPKNQLLKKQKKQRHQRLLQESKAKEETTNIQIPPTNPKSTNEATIVPTNEATKQQWKTKWKRLQSNQSLPKIRNQKKLLLSSTDTNYFCK